MGKKTTSRSKKHKTLLILVVCGLCSLTLWIAYRADQTQGAVQAHSTAPAALRTSLRLEGTWKGQNNNILNIRADGSGRSRITTRPTNDISYFEWQFDSQANIFTLVETSDSLMTKALESFVGKDSFKFIVEEISGDEFDLVNPLSGQGQRFRRIQDTAVELAP